MKRASVWERSSQGGPEDASDVNPHYREGYEEGWLEILVAEAMFEIEWDFEEDE